MKDEVIKDINVRISDLEWQISHTQNILLDLQDKIDNGQDSMIKDRQKIKELINIKKQLENLP